MNIIQARGLLNEIEALLYSGSYWDVFWRSAFNEICARDVDSLFIEALAKLHALGALDADLNNFINNFIRSQIQRFYNQLYRTRRWHLVNGHIYIYSDVLHFVQESQVIIQLLRKKIERIHAESCKVSEEFSRQPSKQPSKQFVICGTGLLVSKG